MSESKSSEPRPLSETPHRACHSTKEELLQIPGVEHVMMDCPGCAAFGIRCMVLSHPTAASSAPAQATAAPPAPFCFYVVTGSINACHSVKGWRAAIYAITARSLGYYNIDKGNSLFYDGENLKLKMLFKTVEHARLYVIGLQERSIIFGLQSKVSMNPEFEAVTLAQEPPYVRAEDYESSDFDSPDHSLFSPIRSDDSASAYSICYPEQACLTIEDRNLPYIRNLRMYKCHLMSIQNHPGEEDNENNFLFLSWSLHQRYDGMVTMGRHQVPQIAIGYEGVLAEDEDVGNPGYPVLLTKVEISIESYDDQILGDVEATLKAGSRRVGAKLYTFVHVSDPDTFSICLMTRYHETLELWSQMRNTQVIN